MVKVALEPLAKLPIFHVPASYLPLVVVLESTSKWGSINSSTITPVALQGPLLWTTISNWITSSTLITSFVTSTALVILKSTIGRAVKLCAESILLVSLMSFPKPVTHTVLVIGPIWITSAVIVNVSKSFASSSPIYQYPPVKLYSPIVGLAFCILRYGLNLSVTFTP